MDHSDWRRRVSARVAHQLWFVQSGCEHKRELEDDDVGGDDDDGGT